MKSNSFKSYCVTNKILHQTAVFLFKYAVDLVISINDGLFQDHLHTIYIYPPGWEIEDNIDTSTTGFYLDLYVNVKEFFNIIV